jgi:hypothetical protein
MKTTNTRNGRNSDSTDEFILHEVLVSGIKVTSPNEYPVRANMNELAPYVKVRSPSRSSTIYDKVE